MDDHVFADSFPAAEAKTIAAAVMTKSFSKSNIRDAWVLAEFGLCQIVPEGKPDAPRSVSDVRPSRPHDVHATDTHAAFEALARHAESFEDAPQGVARTIAPPLSLSDIDWLAILKTILPLIVKVL